VAFRQESRVRVKKEEVMVSWTWKLQYERLKRSLKIIEDQDLNTIDYNDGIWHFFQDCYHLKDWIINDPSVDISIKGKYLDKKHKEGHKVEKYIIDNLDLSICADLANRSKHLKLTHSKGNIEADITRGNIIVTPSTTHFVLSADRKTIVSQYSDPPTKTKQIYTITLSDKTEHIVQDVAKKAVALWDEFLKANGLV
jgi:hypothetical protein